MTPNVQVDIGPARRHRDLAVRRGISTLGVRSTMLNEAVVGTVRAQPGSASALGPATDEATIRAYPGTRR